MELTSRCLRQARALQQVNIDIGSLASEASLTNRLEEGVISGDFGDLHSAYTWTRETRQVASNGLFLVDFTVYWVNEKRPIESRMSILLYRPDSPQRFGGFRGGAR